MESSNDIELAVARRRGRSTIASCIYKLPITYLTGTTNMFQNVTSHQLIEALTGSSECFGSLSSTVISFRHNLTYGSSSLGK